MYVPYLIHRSRDSVYPRVAYICASSRVARAHEGACRGWPHTPAPPPQAARAEQRPRMRTLGYAPSPSGRPRLAPTSRVLPSSNMAASALRTQASLWPPSAGSPEWKSEKGSRSRTLWCGTVRGVARPPHPSARAACWDAASPPSRLPQPAASPPSLRRADIAFSQDGGAGLSASEAARGGAPRARPAPPPLRAAPPGRSPLPSPPARPRAPLLRPDGSSGSGGGTSSSSPAARPRARRGPRMSPGGGGGSGSEREQQAAARRSVGAAPRCAGAGRGVAAGRRRGPLPRREEPRGRVRGLGAPGPAGRRGARGDLGWTRPSPVSVPRLSAGSRGGPGVERVRGLRGAFLSLVFPRSGLGCWVLLPSGSCRCWLPDVALRCWVSALLSFKGTLRDRRASRSVCRSGVRGDVGHALFPSSNSWTIVSLKWHEPVTYRLLLLPPPPTHTHSPVNENTFCVGIGLLGQSLSYTSLLRWSLCMETSLSQQDAALTRCSAWARSADLFYCASTACLSESSPVWNCTRA